MFDGEFPRSVEMVGSEECSKQPSARRIKKMRERDGVSCTVICHAGKTSITPTKNVKKKGREKIKRKGESERDR